MDWESEIKKSLNYAAYLSEQERLKQVKALEEKLISHMEYAKTLMEKYVSISNDTGLRIQREIFAHNAEARKDQHSIKISLSSDKRSINVYKNEKLIESVSIDIETDRLVFSTQPERTAHQLEYLVGKIFHEFIQDIKANFTN